MTRRAWPCAVRGCDRRAVGTVEATDAALSTLDIPDLMEGQMQMVSRPVSLCAHDRAKVEAARGRAGRRARHLATCGRCAGGESCATGADLDVGALR